MKKPFVAFLLNFLLPGAGLVYLGKWMWAFLNLGVVLLIGIAAAILLSDAVFDNYARFIAMGCSGGSGGFAHAMANQMNKQVQINE